RVPLAVIPSTPLPALKPRLRVLVGPSSVDVDDGALFASRPSRRRKLLLDTLPREEALTLPFAHRGLARIVRGKLALPDEPAPGQLEIRALTDVLAYARQLERAYGEIARADGEDLDVYPSIVANVY